MAEKSILELMKLMEEDENGNLYLPEEAARKFHGEKPDTTADKATSLNIENSKGFTPERIDDSPNTAGFVPDRATDGTNDKSFTPERFAENTNDTGFTPERATDGPNNSGFTPERVAENTNGKGFKIEVTPWERSPDAGPIEFKVAPHQRSPDAGPIEFKEAPHQRSPDAGPIVFKTSGREFFPKTVDTDLGEAEIFRHPDEHPRNDPGKAASYIDRGETLAVLDKTGDIWVLRHAFMNKAGEVEVYEKDTHTVINAATGAYGVDEDYEGKSVAAIVDALQKGDDEPHVIKKDSSFFDLRSDFAQVAGTLDAKQINFVKSVEEKLDQTGDGRYVVQLNGMSPL